MPRLFISYGRGDAEDLALRLADDLTHAGHDVWFDRNEIKAGRAWEAEIETGILRSDAVIALLSPHAVRRPDGVCLDEISLARYNGRRIIPAMVLPCRPPLGIYRLDRIDFQNWRKDADFERAFARLTKAIQEPTQPVEGAYAALFSRLRPLDFGREVSRLTQQFVGRAWLFDQINEWLAHGDSPVFLITGDPGIGKSALLASLVDRQPNVRAYHFCVANLADSLDPVRFVRSIAAQLATQLDSYRAALEAIDPASEHDPDPGTLMRRLIADPLRAEAVSEPVVIVIDALDESLGYPGRNIAKLVAERLPDLPPSVRLIVSSRENPEVLDIFSGHDPCSINGAHENNLRDAASFLESRLSEPVLAELLKSQSVRADELAEIILSKSRGNFLYLRHTLDALRAKQIDPRRPDAFPEGLVGVYYAFFQRVFPDPSSYVKVRHLLDVIVASREPLTAREIGACLNCDPFDVEQELQRVADFFPERDGRHQAFHKSITDWLSGVEGRSRRFRVNVDNGHQLLAARVWQEYQSGADLLSDFAVQHGPYHLHQTGRRDEERRLTADRQFIRRRLALGRGIFLSHSYRQNEQELVRRVVESLNDHGHSVFTTMETAHEDEWRRHAGANIPSASIAIGFAYARNSPYLREEWGIALSSGIPLLLIVAEDSPWLSSATELAGVPCFDMRKWRNAETEYLCACSQLFDFLGEGVPSSGRSQVSDVAGRLDLSKKDTYHVEILLCGSTPAQ